MSKPLSLDLRERVVAAVAEGLSRRKAAERFGVSAASSVRWCALERDQGDPKPKPMGGDQRSQRMEAHADFIMAPSPKSLTSRWKNFAERLAGKGVGVAVSTLWRFFARRDTLGKKDSSRERTGASRRKTAARRLVRRPARSRSRPVGLYR